MQPCPRSPWGSRVRSWPQPRAADVFLWLFVPGVRCGGAGAEPRGAGNVLGGFALQIGAETSNKSREQLTGSRGCGGGNAGAQQLPRRRDPARWGWRGDPTAVPLQMPEVEASPAIRSSQWSVEGRRRAEPPRPSCVPDPTSSRARGVSGCPAHAWAPPAPVPVPQPGSPSSLLVFITLLQAQHQEPNLE